MRKVTAMFLASAMMISSVAAIPIQAEETEYPETGKLVLYAGALEDECNAIGQAFEDYSGIDTEVVVLGGGEILARVQAESSNPTASIWWGGGCDSIMNAKDQGLMLQYFSPTAEAIPENLKDADGYWTGVYTGYLGFVCNVQRLEELGIDTPDSWDDLLQEELKGEIMFAAPNASSTGYNVLATIIQLMGEEEGMDYMVKLNDQVASYSERGTGWITPVTTGEIAVGLCYLQDAVDLMANEGYGDILTISTPSEGTGYEMGAVGIIAGGPDINSAQQFVDWCLTPEAQNINQEYGHYVFLTNPDASTPEAAAELAKTTKLIEYDFLWAADQKSDLLEKWEEATGN